MIMMTRTLVAWIVLTVGTITTVRAHDTWVETNTNLVRPGDVVHIDLKLGNHGNGHRDFRLAGKLATLEGISFEVVDPSGTRYDLKDRLRDMGYTPQEGYWTARFEPEAAGLYVVAHRLDRVMTYAPSVRSRGAKTYFVATPSLDRPSAENPGFDRTLGHELELVPVVNPVTPMGPGVPLRIKLLYKGTPLAGESVAFIPRGGELKAERDDRYERTTDAEGIATFEPNEANCYLVVATGRSRKSRASWRARRISSPSMAQTLTVHVPAVFACCGE